ncbi:MAG: MBL fold metallo-hydrolase [Actinomycetota bacterium]|nr:MBL fold metallo-hydrolase [Actinomycetota bacterium]
MSRDRFVLGFPLGRWETNCYVLGDRSARTAVVIDPGEGGTEIVPDVLAREGVTCAAIMLTHGHLDHLWAAPELGEKLEVPIFLHPHDRWLWDNPAVGFGSVPPDALEWLLGRPWVAPTGRLEDLEDGQRLSYHSIELEARHTPGHTPGHVTFLVGGLGDAELLLAPDLQASGVPAGQQQALLSGDLLFRDSVGRTDLPRGSTDDLFESIARSVLPLGDDLLVLPGHMQVTTLGRERTHNPFLTRLGAGRRPGQGPQGPGWAGQDRL